MSGDHGHPAGSEAWTVANRVEAGSPLTPLMSAAGRGDTEKVRKLLAAGALVNVVDARAGASALHKACQGGHMTVVRLLVEGGSAIDLQAATTGHTPLIEAIWFKADDIVEYLLDRNARLEPKTYYGFTLDDHIAFALKVSHGAGDQEKLGRIQQLVAGRRGRDAAAAQAAALVTAALKGDAAALRAGLEAGCPIDARFPIMGGFEDGHTALLVAAREGHADLVAELIRAGADVNAVDPVFGAVPLHKATYNGHTEIAKSLAAVVGVEINYQGASNGYTPLQDALWHGFEDCAAVLLDAGARVDIVAYDGKSAADLSAEKFGPDHALTRRIRSLAALR